MPDQTHPRIDLTQDQRWQLAATTGLDIAAVELSSDWRQRRPDANRIDRPRAEACLVRAQQLHDAGHAAEALAAVRESLTHCPLAKARIHLAHAALANGDFDAALAAYQEAIRLDPYDLDEYLVLRAAFERAGLIDRALSAFHDRPADLMADPPPTVAVPDPVAAFLSHLSHYRAKQICAHHLRSVIGDLHPATIWELLHVPDEDRWGPGRPSTMIPTAEAR